MSHSLAVRRAAGSALAARLSELLDSFAADDTSGHYWGDYSDEIFTAVRHFPAREAEWADVPSWVHADLAAAYAGKNGGQESVAGDARRVREETHRALRRSKRR